MTIRSCGDFFSSFSWRRRFKYRTAGHWVSLHMRRPHDGRDAHVLSWWISPHWAGASVRLSDVDTPLEPPNNTHLSILSHSARLRNCSDGPAAIRTTRCRYRRIGRSSADLAPVVCDRFRRRPWWQPTVVFQPRLVYLERRSRKEALRIFRHSALALDALSASHLTGKKYSQSEEKLDPVNPYLICVVDSYFDEMLTNHPHVRVLCVRLSCTIA